MQPVETINEPNIVATWPRLTSTGQLSAGLPVPDEATTGALIHVTRVRDRLRRDHLNLLVGGLPTIVTANGIATADDARRIA